MKPVWLPQDIAESYLLPRIQSTGVGDMLAMGVLDMNDHIVGCAAIHDWNPDYGICEVSAAADTPLWMSRDVLIFFFTHTFDVMNLQMVYAKIASNNPRAKRFWKMLGSVESVIPRGRGRDVDEIVMSLTKETWEDYRMTRLKR